MAITTQILEDGERNVTWKVIGTGAVGGESATLDISTLAPIDTARGLAAQRLKLKCLWFNAQGEVSIDWDATANVLAWMFGPGLAQDFNFHSFGGIPNNAGAGRTGNVIVSTAADNVSFAAILHFTKQRN